MILPPRRRRRNDVERTWALLLIRMRALGRRRALAILVCGLLGLTGSSAISLVTRGPLPGIHDEFAYLLAADTFANWRLTNPTHPHWEHFETFHVLMQPTYASKYPPAQGVVLAAGQLVTGSAVAGVWLSAGLMAAAMAWMLLMWLPPHWAVLASIFATVQLTWVSYWGHSYWGGSVAAAGGALAFGALRGLAVRPTAWLGVILGAGLAVLAASRPYEGAVAGVCVAVAIGFGFASTRRSGRGRQLRALLCASCIVATGLAWLAYYNWRVTGSAVTMPHYAYQVRYSANPLLLVGDPGERPTYLHPEMERLFIEWGEERQRRQRFPIEIMKSVPIKLLVIVVSLVGVGSVALLGVPGIIRRGSLRFVFITTAAVVGAALLTAGSYPHYVAPVASLFYIMVGAALCYLHRKAVIERSTNLAVVTVAVFVVLTAVSLAQFITAPHTRFGYERAVIMDQLEGMDEKSLVFVTYEPTHNIHEEWVQNRADIDRAKVVWARSMTAAKNQQLIDYFSDRKVWLLAPDRSLELEPYSSGAGDDRRTEQ